MTKTTLSALLGLSLLLTACPEDSATADPPQDAAVIDAGEDAALDATIADADRPDAVGDDAAILPDAAIPDAAPDAAQDASIDADPDAAPPPETCLPPCPTMPACDGHLVCEAGQCVPLERMQCEGGCVDGACAEVNCQLPEDQCAGPLKWLADLVRYNGEMQSLRSMMVGAVNDTSDRVFCTSDPFESMRCVEPEDPVRRVCEARNVSRAIVEGALELRDETIEQCNEFSLLRDFEMTAADYSNTPFGDDTPRLRLNGVASRSDETYYAPSWRWRVEMSIGSAVARFDRPTWAPLGLTRMDANGRYSRGAEDAGEFASAGYRETQGMAQTVRPDGRQWRAQWHVRWQVPFDGMAGEMPQRGCLGEPWSGQAEVEEVMADGTPGSTWVLLFDGSRGGDFCEGLVSVVKDGLVAPPLNALPF